MSDPTGIILSYYPDGSWSGLYLPTGWLVYRDPRGEEFVARARDIEEAGAVLAGWKAAEVSP